MKVTFVAVEPSETQMELKTCQKILPRLCSGRQIEPDFIGMSDLSRPKREIRSIYSRVQNSATSELIPFCILFKLNSLYIYLYVYV